MKKLYLSLAFLALSSTLFSCASALSPVSPERQSITAPEISTVNKKEIGESLVVKSDVEKYEALKIVQVPERKIFVNKSYVLVPGDVLPLLAKTKQHDLYFKIGSVKEDKAVYDGNLYTTYSFYGLAKSIKVPTKIEPFSRTTTGAMGGTTVIPRTGIVTEPAVYFSLDCKDCIKQEFIFNGRVGNSLKFLYREYVEDLARPAFVQDLQYDLSQSNIVGFKGLRIEVINANNTGIEYKLIKTFD